MNIVPLQDIPTNIIDTPTEDLKKLQETCLELQQLCEQESGVGISAVQAGIPWRLFLVKADNFSKFNTPGKYGYFLNCKYKPVGDEKIKSIEGCLSIRTPEGQQRNFEVERYRKIRLTGSRLIRNKILEVDEELEVYQGAVVFAHEVDHHFLITIDQIGKEIL
jgi:peptide deformylase